MLIKIFPVFLFIFLVGCSAVGSGVGGSGCEGCDNVRKIKDTYNANPVRAENEYVGNYTRIGGVAREIGGQGIFAYIHLENNATIRLVAFGRVPMPQPEETHRAWESWVSSQNLGDVVEADCIVAHVAEHFSGEIIIGTEECVPFGVPLPEVTGTGGS